VEFINGDHPGVRLTRAATMHSVKHASGSERRAAVKTVRGKSAKETEKKR